MPSAGAGSPTARAKPQTLPRGRHGLTPEVVRDSQKERLITAMLRLVAERGYAATTVPAVVAAARVSRNAFYKFFTDKEACFIAVCEHQGLELREATLISAGAATWQEALRDGLRGYLAWWQARPEFCQAYFVELPTVSTRAIAHRERLYAPFVEIFTLLAIWARRENKRLKVLPERVPVMLATSITEVIATEVRAGRQQQITRLEPDLWYLIVMLIAGETRA